MLFLGPGRLGAIRLPLPSGGDPGCPVDLEPVQRPVGPALPGGPRSGITSDTRRPRWRWSLLPGSWATLVSESGSLGARGTFLLVLVWLSAMTAGALGLEGNGARMARIPHPIGLSEAAEIQRWIGRVGADEAVLATYEVTAPLSSGGDCTATSSSRTSPRDFQGSRPNSAGSSSGRMTWHPRFSRIRGSGSCTREISWWSSAGCPSRAWRTASEGPDATLLP